MFRVATHAALALYSPSHADDTPEVAAAAALEKRGAKVFRHDGLPTGPVVKIICADKCDLSDDDFKLLAALPELRKAYITGQKRVTGAGLVHLKGSKNLEEIDLAQCPIESTHIADITALPKLWKLGLWETSVGDDALAHLKDHKTLKNLYLSDTKVTDKGLKNLGSMPLLRNLRLDDTLITDDGLRILTKQYFPNLPGADVGGSKVTEAGAAAIGAEQGMKFSWRK